MNRHLLLVSSRSKAPPYTHVSSSKVTIPPLCSNPLPKLPIQTPSPLGAGFLWANMQHKYAIYHSIVFKFNGKISLPLRAKWPRQKETRIETRLRVRFSFLHLDSAPICLFLGRSWVVNCSWHVTIVMMANLHGQLHCIYNHLD